MRSALHPFIFPGLPDARQRGAPNAGFRAERRNQEITFTVTQDESAEILSVPDRISLPASRAAADLSVIVKEAGRVFQQFEILTVKGVP
ncbi:MAG: hypothetical protein GY862_23925 [Gammaproteobacteria bacterium]|nr:hypothetical protein [Gammaproteobacteria bacterium]